MSTTEPFSPLPDDGSATVPAADRGPDAPGADAPAAGPGRGVDGYEPERDSETAQRDADLDAALEGREDPPFRTPRA